MKVLITALDCHHPRVFNSTKGKECGDSFWDIKSDKLAALSSLCDYKEEKLDLHLRTTNILMPSHIFGGYFCQNYAVNSAVLSQSRSSGKLGKISACKYMK